MLLCIFLIRKGCLFQAGEFFHSVRSIAEAQHQEYAANQSGEESLETPLLSEKVL